MTAFQNFLAGHQYGTSVKQQREAAQREQQFNQLASQAYSATGQQRQQLVGQAVGVDAARGMQLDEGLSGVEDRRNRTLLNAAKLLTSAPEPYRNSVYQQIRGGLSQYIPNMPEQYDDTVAQAAKSIVDAYSGAQTGTAVQSRFIDDQGNVVALMRDGSTQIVGKADPSMQILEGEGGFYGVNRRNLQAAPVQLGGGQPQQAPAPSQAIESSGRPVALDPSLPDNVRAQIAANPDAFAALPEMGAVELPPVNSQGSSAQFAPQPQSAQIRPRDPVQDAIARKQAEAQIEMQTAAEIERAKMFGREAGGAQAAAQFGSDEARKAAREAQTKIPQLQNVARGIGRIEAALKSLEGGALGGLADTGPVDQFVTRYTPQGRELESAVGGIQNSMLALTRVPGVGAQSDLEARVANLQYPSLDNPPEVNARTLENLRQFVADLEAAYQNVIQSGQAAPTQQPSPPSAPRRLRFNPATGKLE